MTAPANTEPAALRGYLARILGWSAEQAIEQALRSIELAVGHRAALVVLGGADLVPIAQALHRRTIGADHPFVVCDPRRLDPRASVRSPMSQGSAVAAFHAAVGGSMCVCVRRMPRDFAAVIPLVRDPAAPVQLVLLADAVHASHPFLVLPAPIRVPPLSARTSELPRIVDEYALDAIRDLSADMAGLAHVDRDWLIEHSASTLPEIAKGTRRLVALRQGGSIVQAAARLGMSHVALAQWFGRRGIRVVATRGREATRQHRAEPPPVAGRRRAGRCRTVARGAPRPPRPPMIAHTWLLWCRAEDPTGQARAPGGVARCGGRAPRDDCARARSPGARDRLRRGTGRGDRARAPG
jgi:hypothetical protein